MMAEVVVDVLNAALGRPGEVRQRGAGRAAGPSRSAASRVQNQTANYAFRIFGRPPRTTACDCERAMEPALPQKLFLMTDPNLQQKLSDPANRLKRRCSRSHKDDNDVLEELFLATLIALARPTRNGKSLPDRPRKNARIARTAFTDTAVGADQHDGVHLQPLKIGYCRQYHAARDDEPRIRGDLHGCSSDWPTLTGGLQGKEDHHHGFTFHDDCEGFHRRDFLKIGAAGAARA